MRVRISYIRNGSDSDVVQVYPIAFIEFHKDADGKVTREGPRREKDELAAHDAWTVRLIPDSIPSFHFYPPQKKRDREYQRLRKDADDKCKQYIDWAQRFEAKSASWHPREDGTRFQFNSTISLY